MTWKMLGIKRIQQCKDLDIHVILRNTLFAIRRKYRGNHAEVEALNSYKGSLFDVSAFVTLEPCAFVGRTPSCAKTLASSSIRAVYVAMLDPDPRNSGKGIEILRGAGVSVTLGLCEDKVQQFLSPYLGLS